MKEHDMPDDPTDASSAVPDGEDPDRPAAAPREPASERDTPASVEAGLDDSTRQLTAAPSKTSLRRRWLALPLVAALGLAIAASVLPLEPAATSPAAQPTLSAVATPSSPATMPAPTAPTPPPAPERGPAASAPTGFTFPAAGIHMGVLPLTPSGTELAAQTLVPPLTIDAYWLTSYGVPGDGSVNTTYIAGHSWEGRDAPFNRLSDESLVGKEFSLTTGTGIMTFVVDSVTTHDKDTLKDSDIWNVVPNRVVLISCYTEDPWGKNVVVTALPKAG